MPILRNADQRREELASRVDALGQRYVTDVERHNSFGVILLKICTVFIYFILKNWVKISKNQKKIFPNYKQEKIGKNNIKIHGKLIKVATNYVIN